MNRKVVTAIFALSAVLAISALAQAQSGTDQQTGLTNPGFEEPRGKEASVVLVETMPGWKTTDSHFEIWGSGFKEVAAHEGTQFVELNAYINGTLYQDSTGIPRGSVLEFTFAHRGRSGDDTMMLSIGDLGADNALGGGDDTILFANKYTTGKDAWAVYNSTTEPEIKALGNTVMFAYSAVSTATGELGEGNLLDAANFGVGVVSEAPPTNAMKLDVDGGAFAFGYRTTEQPGFTEFPNTDSPHPGITRRNRADGEYFSFAQNTRETEVIAQETSLVHYPAKSEGSGVLCPGQNQGDVAIARFTAMNDGEYHFKITAQLIEEDPTGAGVAIYVDKQAVAKTQLNKHLVPWTTSSVVKLTKGQTFDIVVDSGEDKNWEKDHVLVTAKAWTTGPSIPTVSSDSNILEVPIYAQQTGMWCWATSGEMIMKYHGVPVAQCKQANDYYPKRYKEQFTDLKIDCCGFLSPATPVDSRIVLGGWPQYADYGFTVKYESDSPLSFEEIKAQIDAKQPIGFAWSWKSGGAHYMVLTGYKTVAGVPMIKINDPGPHNVDKLSNPTDHTRWMTYAYWCNSETHTHLADEYDIKKKP